MPGNQLNLHLGCYFALQYVCEMTQLVCSTAHKLVQVEELGDLFVSIAQLFEEWFLLRPDLVLILS